MATFNDLLMNESKKKRQQTASRHSVDSPQVSNDVLIRVESVSKKFCRDLKRSLWYGMKDLGSELICRRHDEDELRKDEFWAVRDISFEVKRGECIALIGKNGAGKTTLLRMLNGLIKPDTGRIETRGRVGALIALGAGFNSILTGRENIHINAAILGFSRTEVKKKINSIIEFSELGDFIDSPVQHYSSGMFIRLGFSVAANFDPDILLVDEALSVGDLSFTVKCLNRIAELRRKGTCIVFVSHNELQVREAAQRCLLLNQGNAQSFENIEVAFRAYGQLSETPVPIDPDVGFVHDGPVKIRYAGYHTDKFNSPLRSGQPGEILLEYNTERDIDQVDLDLRIWNSTGQLVTNIRSSYADQYFRLSKGISFFQIAIQSIALPPGNYRLASGVRRNGEVLGWTRDLAFIEIHPSANKNPAGGMIYHLTSISEVPLAKTEEFIQ
jgi:lipopolysaccharide transport system ATP-binding protein